MRLLLIAFGLVALGGCAETVQGPRVVAYTPDRFYIRHLPWRDSRTSVDRLANSVCVQHDMEAAALDSADQWVWFDIRYATYTCTDVTTSEHVDETPAPS